MLCMMTLTDFLKSQNMTQAQAAAHFGISRSYLAEIISGAKKPGRETIEKIERESAGAVPAGFWFGPEAPRREVTP